jgi:hypothetical protein
MPPGIAEKLTIAQLCRSGTLPSTFLYADFMPTTQSTHCPADSSVDVAVDIVYLWVDGSDPVWQGKRRRAYANWINHNPNELAVFGNAAGRYRDNGELRFSLRALEKFFPQHGHVYIVTDGQAPHWLRRHSGVTLVDHKDLLPAGQGPVFDSGNIETYLHRIKGLSERFIYMNDDVFFGAPVDINWWFGRQPKVFLEASSVPHFDGYQPGETSLVNASLLSRDWLGQHYPGYEHEARVFSHAPRPMLKNAMLELESLAPVLFEQIRSTVFRSWRVPAIVPDLVPRWMVQMGYAEQRTLDPLHICACDVQAEQQLVYLAEHFGDLPFFCINDTCDEAADGDLRLLRISHALQDLLPQPSSFELAYQAQTEDALRETNDCTA